MKAFLWLCFLLTVKLAYLIDCVKIIDTNVLPRNTPNFTPEWESLDSRKLPTWYDEFKIGIFVHWGVYSVPNFGSEWFWYNWVGEQNPEYVKFMKRNYPPKFNYQDFGSQFMAELYNPDEWADLFEKSGAKYVVFTSKHHEGYAMWPSKYSFSWNSQEVGPNRDLLGELAASIRNKTDMKFGIYHSMYEWFHPLYLRDKYHGWTEDDFAVQKVIPELYELVELYKPEIVWSDGDWEAPDSYWGSRDFLAWLFNSSPVKDTVVVNDRWGSESLCKHGSFYTCSDRYNPGVLQKHKWENAMTIDKKSWGYRENANISDYMIIEDLIKEIVTTVSCGGNILINVGPTSSGTISPIYQERLLQVGEWLSINGKSIYETIPWKFQNDSVTDHVWYTFRPEQNHVYIIFLKWPKNNDFLYLRYDGELFTKHTKVFMVNKNEDVLLEWTIIMTDDVGRIEITLPNLSKADSKWAWVLKAVNPTLMRR